MQEYDKYEFDIEGTQLRTYRGNARTVTVPEGVTSIEYSAFTGSGVESVILPSTLETIGYSAFKACTGLESVVIPEGVKSIRDEAFRGCTSLKGVVLPKGLISIGRWRSPSAPLPK